MSEIDLVPTDYRRLQRLRVWIRKLAFAYLGLMLSLGGAKAGLVYGVRAKSRKVEQLQTAREVEQRQRGRLDELRSRKAKAQKRLSILSGLRGGVAARQMLAVVDRALDGEIWFLDWTFRRAGELVENDPESVHTGYFIVLPMEKQDQREKAWLMRTHMEIRAQAVDHSALAGFVERLVDQPEIEEVRVLNTQVQRRGSSEVVDFELAVVVRSQA